MSFLKGLFGGSAPKKPEKSALEQLEEKADILEKRIAHQRNQIAEQENIARTHANTNKTRALAALKRKKQLEEDVKTDEGILDNINGQRRMLEKASHNVDLLRTMAEASKEVKRQQHNLDINKIEDIVDEMNEQKEISEEISNILSKTTVKEEDDEALLKELNAMSQQELDAKLLQTETLPDVPKQLPALPASTSRKKDEEELDELKNWASAAQ